MDLKQIVIISLNSFITFVMEMGCVHCAVRTESVIRRVCKIVKKYY
jgi:hypothetical protein